MQTAWYVSVVSNNKYLTAVEEAIDVFHTSKCRTFAVHDKGLDGILCEHEIKRSQVRDWQKQASIVKNDPHRQLSEKRKQEKISPQLTMY